MLQSDRNVINDLIHTIVAEARNLEVHPHYQYIYDYQVSYLEKAMAFDVDRYVSKTLESLLFCNGSGIRAVDKNSSSQSRSGNSSAMSSENVTVATTATTVSTTTEENGNSGGHGGHSYSWVNLQDQSQCAKVFKHLKGNITAPHVQSDLDFVEADSVEKQYTAYRETIKTIFGNSTFDVSNVEDHAKCLDLELNYTALDNILILMTQLAVNVSEAETYDEAYCYAVQIPPLYRERLRYDETKFFDLHVTVHKLCGWLYDYALDVRNNNKVLEDFGKIMDDMDAASRQLNNLNNYLLQFYNEIVNKIEPTIRLGKEYIEKKITKVKLAENFLTPFFTKVVQDVAEIITDMTVVNKVFLIKKS